ncbi:Leucine-rich repeat protein [Schistosoma japonicum]|nr:Leucine-rich repeat protein [Schistosoma japonicum]
MIHGIICPQIITTTYNNISNNNVNFDLQWYLSAISGYSNEILKEYFNTWNNHKSLPYQLIRCLLPPYEYRTCKSIPSDQIQQQNMNTTKQNHHLNVALHHQKRKFINKTSNRLKSSRNLIKQIDSEKDYFSLSMNSINASYLSTNSVILLTDLLEAGFKCHDLTLVNHNLPSKQHIHLKPYVVYPCIFSDNNSMEFYCTNKTNNMNMISESEIEENVCIQEIWFPIDRPMGYFNRLSVNLCKVICDQTKYTEYCNSLIDLKYTEKLQLNDSYVKHNTFIVAYDYSKIILEEVTVNGSIFGLPEYYPIYGIRCIQQTKQIYMPTDNIHSEDITFNPLQWFIETCNQLNDEIQGIVWFWSK